MIFLDVDVGIDYKVMTYKDFRVQQAGTPRSGNDNPVSYDCWEKKLHNSKPKSWGVVPGKEPGPSSH